MRSVSLRTLFLCRHIGKVFLYSLPPPLTSHLRSWPLPGFLFLYSTYLHFVYYLFPLSLAVPQQNASPESASASVTSLKLNTVLGTQEGLSKCVLSECMNAFAFYENPWGKGTVNAGPCGSRNQSQMTEDNYSSQLGCGLSPELSWLFWVPGQPPPRLTEPKSLCRSLKFSERPQSSVGSGTRGAQNVSGNFKSYGARISCDLRWKTGNK